MSSPTARTLQALREAGWTAQVVEKWIPQTRQRKDLFGFIDIVAIGGPFSEIVGVQATSSANMSARIEKIEQLSTPLTWVQSRGRIIVVGWRKGGPRGKRKLWQARIVELVNGGGTHDWIPVEIEHPDFNLEGQLREEIA